MNSLIEKNVIFEMDCGSNFAYILNDNNIFLSTEYKVLQNQANSCFVKCMKMLYNGKIQLFYLTKNIKPLSSMLSTLDNESFVTILSNLFTNIIDVKHNGFLSCQSIDISMDRIYVDPTTYKVFLVYVPVSRRLFSDYSHFENELRTCYVRLISDSSNFSSAKISQLRSDLANGTLSLEEVNNKIKGSKIGVVNSKPSTNVEKSVNGYMKLVGMNSPSRVEIVVDKDEFVIGKKAELCDGVIDFNKMISRSHCKIIRTGKNYSIVDLQSANGTFVNRVRMQPNTPFPINNGDVIRLANSDFQVTIG